MRTPRSAWTMWLTGLAFAVAVVPLVVYSGKLYYDEGGTSPDAPGMLVASLLVTSPIWMGAWVAIMACYLVRYSGAVPLHPALGRGLGAPLALVAIVGSVFLMWLTFTRVEFWRPSRLPFTAHLLGLAVYLQYLRAAAVARSLR